MCVVERGDVLDERILEVEIVGLMNPLQPGRQSVQIESDDVSFPFIGGVLLREHARELNEIRIPLLGGERLLCSWSGNTDGRKQSDKDEMAHNGVSAASDRRIARN